MKVAATVLTFHSIYFVFKIERKIDKINARRTKSTSSRGIIPEYSFFLSFFLFYRFSNLPIRFDSKILNLFNSFRWEENGRNDRLTANRKTKSKLKNGNKVSVRPDGFVVVVVVVVVVGRRYWMRFAGKGSSSGADIHRRLFAAQETRKWV